MKVIGLVALIAFRVAPALALGQQTDVELRVPVELSDSAITQVATDVATKALAANEPHISSQASSLIWLELAAGRYEDASKALHALRENDPSLTPLELFTATKLKESASHSSFPDALTSSFREMYGKFDDKSAYEASEWMGSPPPEVMRQRVVAFLNRKRDTSSLSLDDAVELSRLYVLLVSYRAMAPYTDKLVADDNAKRYIVDDNVLVRTPDGAMINAIVARPRSSEKPLPTLLTFTIYTYTRRPSEAIQTASNGFVGVVGFSRGKRNSTGAAVPYDEHDGDDARALIEWIGKQPWSDGRVGMWGGSYDGYTQWAAAKRLPPALKAIMSSVTAAPGIDVPMQGNIFVNFMYPFPFYTADNNLLDDATYNDSARWNKLNKTWYLTGMSYRSLEKIDGAPNPIFRGWIDHPSYDSYWQRLIPYDNEFAKIDIPVLQTFGYYGDGGQGALYYFTQHRKYDSHADHTLLVGPYDHGGGQYMSADILDGYSIDPVARMNIPQLRYEWFTYLFKGGPKPTLLKDVVNYEVMGADKWEHAPSIEKMSNARLRFYLAAGLTDGSHALRSVRPPSLTSDIQTVDFRDRSDVDTARSDLIVSDSIDSRNAWVYVSEPLDRPIEVSGLFSGHFDLESNKKDMDIEVRLFEQMPNGEYFRLSYSQFRASYVRNRSVRQLLKVGKRQSLDFRSEILTSRLMQGGSRIVIVLGIVKRSDLQINYGTGKDVSNETIEDANTPLRIKWFSDSYIELPIKR